MTGGARGGAVRVCLPCLQVRRALHALLVHSRAGAKDWLGNVVSPHREATTDLCAKSQDKAQVQARTRLSGSSS